LKLLLLAAPGGGKGTQGERLASLYAVQHVSSGDVLRAEAHASTPVGREVAGYQQRGDLVPDRIVFEVNGDQPVEAITAEIQARLPGP